MPATNATSNLIKGAVRVGLLLNLRIRKLSICAYCSIRCLYSTFMRDLPVFTSKKSWKSLANAAGKTYFVRLRFCNQSINQLNLIYI